MGGKLGAQHGMCKLVSIGELGLLLSILGGGGRLGTGRKTNKS